MTEPMTIGDDSVVSFHYKLRDDTGAFNESSEEGSPVVYMHGHNNIVPGLEKELAGKQSGDKLTATVTPEEGYGQRNESAVQRVPLKHLATRGPFSVGQMVVVNTRDGGRQARVLKVGHFADVVVFDPKTIRDTATFDDPHQYASGMKFVFVNGDIAVKDGSPTGALAGRALVRPDAK